MLKSLKADTQFMISHEKFEEQLDPIFNRIFLSDKNWSWEWLKWSNVAKNKAE